MTYERVQKASSWSSQPQEKTSPFTRRPFTVPAQAPTQQEIEDEAIQQNKLEAFGLELQAKYGTITPEGQERLTVLQAKMDAFWQQRRESIERRGGNILQRLLNQGGTSKDEPPPMIQTKLTIGEPGDQYEQEADQVAARVVNQINAPVPKQSALGESVQREEQPEEEKLMMKPEVGIVQRQPGEDGMAATPDLEASIQQARGSGQPLGDSVREPMEQAFGADFSGVKVHTDAHSDQLNQSIQAKAFTTGQDIFFRQGAYEPGSRGGQELIAHELTHVVQQNGSAVQRKTEKQDELEQSIQTTRLESTPDVTSFVQCMFPGTKEDWNSKITSMTGNTATDWVNLLKSLDEDGNSFTVADNHVVINNGPKLAPAALKGIVLAKPNRLKEICDQSRSASSSLKLPSEYINELILEFNSLRSGGATTQAVTGADQGYHNETFASDTVKPEDVVAQWKVFLGPGPYGKIHPRTGVEEPDRLVSSDGTRTIRYGNHERTSKPNKHHYHEETWTYDNATNKMNVDNLVRRVPLKEK